MYEIFLTPKLISLELWLQRFFGTLSSFSSIFSTCHESGKIFHKKVPNKNVRFKYRESGIYGNEISLPKNPYR